MILWWIEKTSQSFSRMYCFMIWGDKKLYYPLLPDQGPVLFTFDNVLSSNVLYLQYMSFWVSGPVIRRSGISRLPDSRLKSCFLFLSFLPFPGGFGCDTTRRRWKRSSLQSVNKVCFSGELALAAWSFDRKNLAWASGTRQTYQH